ncbi:XRE family transcriptional regulator [Ornithobacterium rhinotracheale]|uniref:XRE family transcriptional regulator n=1 Tax=Ornithobacterium rhinotracheale TaxID=28251 RepID=UPI00129CDDE7|nr:XRE family transcriptional regulator [Ornithobacterium rhinotracheale]MRI64690.1 XRE family transcriptional regulator [Ornithobacterium rhinotracheale]
MNKNKTLAKAIKEKHQTPYQKLAKEFNTSPLYIGQIARGERHPIRGKGLAIKRELEKIINQ